MANELVKEIAGIVLRALRDKSFNCYLYHCSGTGAASDVLFVVSISGGGVHIGNLSVDFYDSCALICGEQFEYSNPDFLESVMVCVDYLAMECRDGG